MSKVCSIPDCVREYHASGLCKNHYRMKQYYDKRPDGTLNLIPRIDDSGKRAKCAFVGCFRNVSARGLCTTHYKQQLAGEELRPIYEMDDCPMEFCDKKKSVRIDLCKRCAQFKRRYSLTLEETLTLGLIENRHCGNVGCTGSTLKLHLDHDHACCPPGKFKGNKKACGKCVRGWLCQGCNMALGSLNEDPDRIRGLLEYLTPKTTR